MIVIQCATQPEFEALKNAFNATAIERAGKREFFAATPECFVLRGSVGKVWAAAAAEFAITRWSPKLMIDFGAAGGLVEGLAVGDIVLAERVVEHDVSAAEGKRPSVTSSAARGLLARGALPTYPKFRSFDGIRVTRGVVAAGDKDIQTLEERACLAKQEGAIAATWESSAVGRVCKLHGVAYASVRVITDTGEQDEFLAEYKRGLKVLDPAAKFLVQQAFVAS